MKTLFKFLLFALLSLNSIAQIPTTNSKQTTSTASTIKEVPKNIKYDSLKNFLEEKPYGYINQELFVKTAQTKIDFGGFHTSDENKKNDTYYYSPNSYFFTPYDSIAGKYFKVLNVYHDGTKGAGVYSFWLQLLRKDNGDTVYYSYDGLKHEYLFPFVCLGYFDKKKKLFEGKKFYFQEINLGKDEMKDKNGKYFTPKLYDVWTCKDVTFDEAYSLISATFVNPTGNEVFQDIEYTNTMLPLSKAQSIKTKYGADILECILKGKVKMGMNKECVTLSWGKPKDINNTIYKGGKHEQWVYSENYVYFDNGVVSGIQ